MGKAAWLCRLQPMFTQGHAKGADGTSATLGGPMTPNLKLVGGWGLGVGGWSEWFWP